MPVNLSIKNAPDAVVERLRQRAKRNHRSLQGELMAIIEDAATQESARPVGDDRTVESPRRGLNLDNLPEIDLGPWPDSVGLRRAEIYGDEGR
jgi:plasmid stability protein